MKVKSNACGKCPFCDEFTLEYGSLDILDDMIYYPWTCTKCGHKGEEWYSIEFAGHNVLDENDDWIELQEDMIEKEVE